MDKITERTINVADIVNNSCGFPPNTAFKQKSYQITVPIIEGEDKAPMGQIKLFGTDETLGTIVIDVYLKGIIIKVPEGPTRTYGKYMEDELSIHGYSCELKGV